jgi:opacity protein-like surface antigen
VANAKLALLPLEKPLSFLIPNEPFQQTLEDSALASDLSGTFEFNLQAGAGVQWVVKDNVALSQEARYVHWSCAGISNPNLGLNGVTGLLGVTFFF